MEKIEQEASIIFTKNLKFLEDNYNDLFKKVSTLSYALEQKIYQERYFLEYIQEKEEFDIFDNQTEKYIYNKDALLFNEKAVSEATFDMRKSLFLAKDIFASIKKIDLDSQDSLEKKTFFKTFDELNEYKTLFPKVIDNKQNNIDKFVFAGVLLGKHIEKIAKKLKSSIYFIYEANLEIFRLSLFCTKYYDIAKKATINFSVMDNNQIVEYKLYSFLMSGFESSYMIKVHSTNYNSDNLLEHITKAYSLINPLNFPHHQVLELLINRGADNASKYNTLNTGEKKSLLKDTPVLYLAAGPSLAKNLEWIKEKKSNFFIVSIGAAVYTLIKNGVIPNLIISIDSKERVLHHFPDEITAKLKNIVLLASTMTNQKVLDLFDSKNVFLFETSLQFKKSSVSLGGFAVGEIGLNLILNLGANNIFTIGNDLALNQETGSSHFEGYVHENKIGLEDKKDTNIIHNDTKVNTKGNFRENVITTVTYVRSLVVYNQIIEKYMKENKEINIYNLSDGAYINNTIPTTVNNVEIDEVYKGFDLKKLLILYSNVGYTLNEKENFKESLLFVDLIKNELNILKNIESTSYFSFLMNRNKVLNLLLSESKKFNSYGLYSVFSKYIILSEQYLYFIFNSDIENEKEIIKQVEKVWISHIESFCNSYINSISRYV